MSTDRAKRYAANRKQPRLVKCNSHGSVPGYVICRCVLNYGAAVAYRESPAEAEDGIGQIVCNRGGRAHSVEELTLICSGCARERGFL